MAKEMLFHSILWVISNPVTLLGLIWTKEEKWEEWGERWLLGHRNLPKHRPALETAPSKSQREPMWGQLSSLQLWTTRNGGSLKGSRWKDLGGSPTNLWEGPPLLLCPSGTLYSELPWGAEPPCCCLSLTTLRTLYWPSQILLMPPWRRWGVWGWVPGIFSLPGEAGKFRHTAAYLLRLQPLPTKNERKGEREGKILGRGNVYNRTFNNCGKMQHEPFSIGKTLPMCITFNVLGS